jgi:Amidase
VTVGETNCTHLVNRGKYVRSWVHEATLGRSSLFTSRHIHRYNWRASVPPVLNDLAVLDAVGQADLVRGARLQPLDLVDAAIDRIERLNPPLNAVITKLYDKARALAVSGCLPNGPFRGVPLLLKDYYCYTHGDPYYEGTKFLRDLDWRSKGDSYLARRLRAAGFIFIGKNEPARTR